MRGLVDEVTIMAETAERPGTVVLPAITENRVV